MAERRKPPFTHHSVQNNVVICTAQIRCTEVAIASTKINVQVFDEAFAAQFAELLAWRRDVRRFRREALPDGLVEPEIDREVVGEAEQVGEAQASFTGTVGGAGHQGQFAVGGGGEDDVARGLPEIDRLAIELGHAGLGG